MPNNSVYYVNYRLEIEGDGLANFLKEVGRPWDFTVSRYGVEMRIVFDKAFSLWNLKRPEPFAWDRYFIRSPFEEYESKDDLWINRNKQMWGPQNDVRDVRSYAGTRLDNGNPCHVITFRVDREIYVEVFQQFLAKHSGLFGRIHRRSINDYHTLTGAFANGVFGQFAHSDYDLNEVEVSE